MQGRRSSDRASSPPVPGPPDRTLGILFGAPSAATWLLALGLDRLVHGHCRGPFSLVIHPTGESQHPTADCFSRELLPCPLGLAQAAVAAARWLRARAGDRPDLLLSCYLRSPSRAGQAVSSLFVAMRSEPPLLRALGIGLEATACRGSIRLFRLPEEARQLELEHDLDLRLLLGRSLDRNLLLHGARAVQELVPVDEAQAVAPTQSEPAPEEDSGRLGRSSA